MLGNAIVLTQKNIDMARVLTQQRNATTAAGGFQGKYMQ